MKNFLFLAAFFFLLTSIAFAQTKATFSLADSTLADQYSNKASQFFKKGQYDSAAYYLDKASAIYQNIANQTNSNYYWKKYIDNLAPMAISYQRLNKNEQALDYLNKALIIAHAKFGEKDYTVAKLCGQIGKFYKKNHQYGIALKNYKRGLAIAEEIYGANSSNLVVFYWNIGMCYLDSTAYKSAEKWFFKALDVLKVNNQYESPDWADILQQLSKLKYNQGNYEKAIEYSKKCINLRKKLFGENSDLLFSPYNTIGNCYYLIGNFDEAYDYYQRALLGYKALEGEESLHVAMEFNNIGMIYFEKHDYEKALDFFQKALTLKRKLKGENHISTATSLNNVGLCFLKLRRFDDAIRNFQKSLKIRIRVFGEIHPDVAASYNYLGFAYAQKNDIDSALKNYQQSLKINKGLFGERHPKIAETYSVIGNLYAVQRDFSQALESYQEALIALVHGFSDTNIYHNPPLSNRLSDKYFIMALIDKGKAFANLEKDSLRRLNNLSAAMNTFELAGELVDQIILNYSSASSKLFVANREREIADNTIETLNELYELTGDVKYQQRQFQFAERAKFAVLQKIIHDSKAEIVSGIPDSLRKHKKKLQEDISSFETQLKKQLRKKKDADSTKIIEFTQKSFALKQDYQNLIKFIEQKYPRYYHLKYRPRKISVQEIQGILADDELMLDYFTASKNLYIFAISHNEFNVVSVAIDDTISQLIASFLNGIKKADLLNFPQVSYHLYKYLIQPVAEEIANKKKLIIIPYEELTEIPFDALLYEQMDANDLNFCDAKYLLNRFEISYYLSAGLYVENFSKQTAASRKEGTGFIGFAPVFDEKSNTDVILANNLSVLKSGEERSVSVDGKHLRSLKFSKDEVQNIAAIFHDHEMPAEIFLYENASEKNFKQEAPNYKFIHIATHGVLNNEYPNLSGVIFSQPTDSVCQEDGILYLGEIYNLSLNADLVALSSCQSGIGKLVSGEGLLSLTRGFVYAGARNLLVSLWKVSDKTTSQLMTDFYRETMEGNSYCAALRQAKLKMIHDPNTAFPKLWGAFVLIGE